MGQPNRLLRPRAPRAALALRGDAQAAPRGLLPERDDPETGPTGPLRRLHSLVDGQAAARQRPGRPLALTDPATDGLLGHLEEADGAMVSAAIASARRAFDAGPWPAWPAAQRRQWLEAAAERLRAHTDELAALEMRHTGLPWAAARQQVHRAAQCFVLAARAAAQPARASLTQAPGYLTRSSRPARGVVAVIAPRAAPLQPAAASLAHWLAEGSVCVLQPSPQAALALSRLVELLLEAGLPTGVLNLLQGRSQFIGAALAGHAGVDLIDCRADVPVARAVALAAGHSLNPLQMEAGGRALALVFDDAAFEAALAGTVTGAYTNNAHSCTAGTHLLVQRGVAERYIAALVVRSAALRVGHPRACETELGPLGHGDALAQLLQRLDQARAQGARLLCGGHRLGDGARGAALAKGHYLAPTALLLEAGADPTLGEEVHAPLTTLTLFDTADEALRLSRRYTRVSAAYVWTQDLALATRVSQALRARQVWVNTPMAGTPLLRETGDGPARAGLKTIGLPVLAAPRERGARTPPLRPGLRARARAGMES